MPVPTWVLKGGPRLQRAERLGRLVGARNEKILVRTDFCSKATCRRSCTRTVLDSQGIRGIKAAMKGEKRGTACKSSSEVRMATPFPDAAVEKPDEPRRGLRLRNSNITTNPIAKSKSPTSPEGDCDLTSLRFLSKQLLT